ncbi:hypothetical protein [Siminovitchia fordii]|uniref:Uncharacterized protein n=1 Tax=Siminovitchia fordii TaxID=254759 RepID=A0ABQ4KBY1_9BACI|nr:hypothetical protein [Siminovitchia fordii]GIN22532.1 hypothetical protein J1TS3_36660 [Siminovitchia fordii]
MKLIDHTFREVIGEMEYIPFHVNDKFRIPLKDKQRYFIVTGHDDYGNIIVFELNRDQYYAGMEIKDLLF